MKTKTSITALCAILLCSVLLFGCSPKDTPTRVGEIVTQASIYFPYHTMDEFIEDADILAEVEIKEWLGETDYGTGSSFFEATVLKEYTNKTGKEFKTIKIKQSGNSKSTIEKFPLFAVGDRLLLGLKDSNKFLDEYGNGTGNGNENEKEQIEVFRDCYYFEGCHAGAIQIRTVGEIEYAMPYVQSPLQDLEEITIKPTDKLYSNVQQLGKELNEELGLESYSELQKQGGYLNITERTVMEADTLRGYIERLINQR